MSLIRCHVSLCTCESWQNSKWRDHEEAVDYAPHATPSFHGDENYGIPDSIADPGWGGLAHLYVEVFSEIIQLILAPESCYDRANMTAGVWNGEPANTSCSGRISE